MKASAICLAFLMLATIRAACQDTLCTTFIIDTVACNNQPYGGCSSHASVPGVIVDSTGVFGCMHPVPQLQVLNCPGGQQCPGNQVVQVQATNPYCQQTYSACGCLGQGCIGQESGGEPSCIIDGDCSGDQACCVDGMCSSCQEQGEFGWRAQAAPGLNNYSIEKAVRRADHSLSW